MFRRGNRWFTSGSLALLLVATAHTLGHFSDLPQDPALLAIVNAMRGYVFDFGFGMRPSFMGIHESISLTMSILLVFMGLQNLATVALVPESRRLIRTLSMTNFVCAGMLVFLYASYQIAPPLISFIVVGLLFLFASVLP